MVVVDKIIKESHFIPIETTHKAANIADIFIRGNFNIKWASYEN